MNDKIDINIIKGSTLANTDYEKTLFEYCKKSEEFKSQADKYDYFVAMASGVLCAILDILWVGEFDLKSSREIAEEKVNNLVCKVAEMFGCDKANTKDSVAFLEKMFPLAADGNTPDFGGGLQHHLRDFAHHPTAIGLLFSLLTQFTEKSYGTDVNGNFIVVPVPDKSKVFIGKDLQDKIVKGTIVWFFHLVSDIAGSSSTAGLGGGTGIPGPILSLAKELSVLPLIKDISLKDESLSVFLSQLFNGTLFSEHDRNGKIIKETVVKFDLRGEFALGIELTRQAIPVIANELIVRIFYFIRRFVNEIKNKNIVSVKELSAIEWKKIKPYKNPTLTRMTTISSAVFSTIDIVEAVISQKYWLSINYVGIGRLTLALGSEYIVFLKGRNVSKIRSMYESIEKNGFNQTDNKIYDRLGNMNAEKLALTLEQTEILYNLQWHKTNNDIKNTSLIIGNEKIVSLKKEWIKEWKQYMSIGFPEFVGDSNAELHWYNKKELMDKIKNNSPEKPWFRLVLLETMLFEPYYTLSLVKDKDGKEIPSKKYNDLHNFVCGYKKSEGDTYLDQYFKEPFYEKGYIRRLRKCYNKVTKELNEVLKTVITSLTITAAVTIATVLTAGMFAPAIAVALVGSNFAGLSGAALTSACLAYLGGGAVAIGGLGMAGGTMAIVGGGAVLGLGVGAGIGGAVGVAGIAGKKQTILQSAKLMVSVREIFLNDEKDLDYSNSVYEQYVQNTMDIEKGIVELKHQAEIADKNQKKQLKLKIKNAEASVKAMKIAAKSMRKFNSSFETGITA